MKKLYLLIILLFFGFCGSTQIKQIDVLYLKNGSVIKGSIIEQIPFQTIKIQTADGSIFVYKMEEVADIKREDELINEKYVVREKKVKTVPVKFSKKVYYANITEITATGYKLKYDDFYFEKNVSLSGWSFGMQTINGVQFLKNNYLGIGVGLNYLTNSDIISGTSIDFPLFLEYRFYFFNKQAQTYISFDAGTVLSSSNFKLFAPFISPSIGVKLPISKATSFNIGLGYSLIFHKANLHTKYSNSYLNETYAIHSVYNNISSLSLKFGFVF